MAQVTLEDVMSLWVELDKKNAERIDDLKSSVQSINENIKESHDKIDKRLEPLEKAHDRKVSLLSWVKPVLISLITAGIIGGITIYGS